MRPYLIPIAALLALALTGCDNAEELSITTKAQAAAPAPSAELKQQQSAQDTKLEFKTVEWTDLMPEEDLEALLNPPSYVTDVEDGSFEDQISSQLQNTLAQASDDRYQQALSSTTVVPEMDGRPIRIPGFIVPLEYNPDQSVSEFFLVPFFGACIHVPPPPPNQIIHVKYPQGLMLESIYDPFWISGKLNTALVENDMATAAYSMQMLAFEAYTEE